MYPSSTFTLGTMLRGSRHTTERETKASHQAAQPRHHSGFTKRRYRPFITPTVGMESFSHFRRDT